MPLEIPVTYNSKKIKDFNNKISGLLNKFIFLLPIIFSILSFYQYYKTKDNFWLIFSAITLGWFIREIILTLKEST